MKKVRFWGLLTWLCLSVSAFCGQTPPVAPVRPTHAVTLPQAHKGTLEVDTSLLDSYRRLPEARRAFYLKAREVLFAAEEATPANAAIVEAARKAGLPLISGPMLGDVSESAITLWCRPVEAGPLQIVVTPNGGGEAKTFALCPEQPGMAVRCRLSGLTANTQYLYRLSNSSGRTLGEGRFCTAPDVAAKNTFSIAFGSCFHKVGVHNPNLMRLVRERGNRAVLLLGDLAVDDREARIHMHHADYLLRDVSAPWRMLAAHVPVYAAWDDHDYLNNDKSGLQRGQIGNPERRALRKVWHECWNNPPTAVEDRGLYFNTVIGGVEIVMLDTRSCRSWEKRGQRGSYLGSEQMEWLLKVLKASKAKFILLTSGTMWSDFMSKAKDSWGTWDKEGREEIYRCIEENRIGGVILLSGDRHGARGFKIVRPSGFAFYEFEAATLGGVRGPGAFAPDRSPQLFGYKGGLKAFGEFTFDLRKTDPEVTFRLINEEGNALETHKLLRSQLTPRAP